MTSKLLSDFVKRKGALSERQLAQVQEWIDDDWESHDCPGDLVALVQRLLDTVRDGVRK